MRSCFHLSREIRFGLSLLVAGWLVACSAPMPAGLGVSGGRLAACPSSPNCVSSDAQDPESSIEAFELSGSTRESWDALREIVASSPRTRIVAEDVGYLHAECTSAIFRYVDDLELLLDEKGGTVSVRSASRIGYSDMNANRKRVERLRTLSRERSQLR